MLKNWTLHHDYQNFIQNQINHFSTSELKRLAYLKPSLDKLSALNFDPLITVLKPYYSTTGRPAKLQPEIFRSFILMLDLGATSITNWVIRLRSDDCLAFIIGCNNGITPSIGAHYALIKRLWLRNQVEEKQRFNSLYPYSKNHSKSKKPGRNTKLPNKKSGIVAKIKDFYLKGRSFSSRYEKLLQEIFALVAVVPSTKLGLIPNENLTIAGDGTAVHCHSNPFGNKICDCRKRGIYNCKCHCKFSDPDANIGWDSYLNQWYYGYTLYALSIHNNY